MKQKVVGLVIIFSFLFTYSLIANIQQMSRNYQELPPKKNLADAMIINSMVTGITAEQMARLLVGEENPSVQIRNISYTGASIASGVFRDARNDGLDIDKGVILSSGYAENLYGPNTSNSITGNNGCDGSANLDALIPGYTTNDASILEFDFTCKYNSIGFNYIFGSDEYLEYVGSSFNDVFGLFLDYQNVALIPGTAVPVSINNVNNVSYSDFYLDNPTYSNNFNVEADGMTTKISVGKLVEPEVSHHISFEVADAGDYILDSWVLLEEGSFQSVQCSTYFEVVIVEGIELETDEDEALEIHAIAYGEDEAHFGWVIYPPLHGMAEFTSDYIEEERTILYTPYPDYNGEDYFVLSVTDGLGGIINRFIEIAVNPVKDAPVNETLPFIWGDFALEGEVECYPGVWNDNIDNQYAEPGGESTISFYYQWQVAVSGIMEWEDIEAATDSTYVITENETGHYIRCQVTAVDNGIGSGFDDTTIEVSNYEYCSSISGVEFLPDLPEGIVSVYPNPFNPSTTISFIVNETSPVKLEIFNVKGQRINVLIDESMNAGQREIVWNGNDNSGKTCPTGFYLIRLSIAENQYVRKLLLMK
ncbi:MAG TPA: choice-of-anchor L domain-containing protein [Candidatus Cloacimonadota bacterium]|nr:choice-of-anchor L domain-containing protein [Candidatus Cloacimonadota bacterium]